MGPRSRWAARRLRPNLTTATMGILIGRLDGVQTRRSGAAPTRRWGARRSVAIEHPAPDTPPACTVWWSLGLHRRSITAARPSTRVVRARSRSEQAAGVRSRIEAARDMYVHN